MTRVVVANVTYANISVGVSITATGNSAGAVTANTLKATTTFVVPAALVSSVQIGILADTDPIGYNRFVKEFSVTTDYARVGFGKRATESVATADSTTYVLFKKGLNELKTTSEVRTFAISKSLADVVHPTDDFYGLANADDDETMTFGKSRSDSVHPTDVRTSSLSKARTDSVAKADVQTSAFGKRLTDANATADVRTASFQKSVADAVDAGDEFNASAITDDGEVMVFGKSQFDSFTQSDSVSVQPEKGVDDSATTGDYLQPFDLGKGITDTPVTSELQAFDVAKPFSDNALTWDYNNVSVGLGVRDRVYYPAEGPNQYDTYALSYFFDDYVREGFPAVSFSKSLTDTVRSTDDFYGVANADDDETMTFGKVLTDLAQPTEYLRYSVAKALADAAASSDIRTSDIGKSRSDTVTKSDTANKDSGKSLADTFGKSDIVVRTAGKGLSDTASTTEIQAFAFSKSLLDSVHPTDDFLGVANADDDEVMSLGKVVTDSFTKSDSVSLTPGKGLADSVSKSDSGTLVWTDYWDINYTVTTSGVFVGNSRTF
jgi:hypothetical protein